MEVVTKTTKQYSVAQLYKGTDTVSSWSAESFDTYEDAVKHWEVEYRDRKKGNEYDTYWNVKPCVIEFRTTTSVLIIHGRETV